MSALSSAMRIVGRVKGELAVATGVAEGEAVRGGGCVPGGEERGAAASGNQRIASSTKAEVNPGVLAGFSWCLTREDSRWAWPRGISTWNALPSPSTLCTQKEP